MNDPAEVSVFTRAWSSCHVTAELLAQSNRFVELGSRLTGESLQQIVGKADIWLRPHQKEGFEIMSLPSYDLVYISGTGSGKSMIFTLPAFVRSTGLTLVICPMIALQKQHTEMLNRHGIKSLS
ncbi:hypothetical protein EDB80DRAFT_863815 [Ilyonectria destructans]|nr:hypothetical protein EDB80DRAFT_863815 [Ilyonectria destructans]